MRIKKCLKISLIVHGGHINRTEPNRFCTMYFKRVQLSRHILNYLRALSNPRKIERCLLQTSYYSTFTLDAFTSDLLERHRIKMQRYDLSELRLKHCKTTNSKNLVHKMNGNELDNMFSELLLKNNDSLIEQKLIECQNVRRYLAFTTLKKLFKHFSQGGKPDMVIILQSYCSQIDKNSYKRNGEFLHYLAEAQCMKGNSEIGLTILKNCYSNYETLRSFYRLIFRDLIQDSVLNKSEASLMVFKKYALEFSMEWSEHYPLLCFWHICWSSTWFSDQILSTELLDASESLQEIVKDKATEFSMMVLRDYNEDAVVRLLQALLKYDMMSEYVAVLQVLFNYKLKNRDIRGCTEIIRNCKVLGVTLPSNQQGRYITMLIEDKKRNPNDLTKLPFKNFKLKF